MAPATKGGMHFRHPPGRLYGFPTGEARLSGFRRQRRHKKWRPIGRRTSPAQRYFITTLGGSPQPVREASAGPGQNPWRPGPSGPAAPSTLARRASTFGNTGKRRFLTKAHNLKCRTQQKSTNDFSLVLFQLISSFLSSRAASSQVLSAFVSLTTVFGMGTGVSSQLSPLNL